VIDNIAVIYRRHHNSSIMAEEKAAEIRVQEKREFLEVSKALIKVTQQRDEAIIERDEAILERDNAIIDRDGCIERTR
jgi:hypothetical protein